MGDFYVTLPSNASASLFPNNKIGNYTTKLPRPIVLDERNWEVAIVQLNFPFSWYNFNSDQYYVVEYFESENNIQVHKKFSDFVPAGYYSNCGEICDKMNESMKI